MYAFRLSPRRRRWFTFLVAGWLLGTSLVVLAQEPPAGRAIKDHPLDAEARRKLVEERELLRLFADTFENIRSNYVRENVTDRELIEAAIQGMLTKLDQYSNFIAPEEIERFRRDVESEFGGIGIQVAQEGDQLTVVSPMYGTPAYQAGVLAGDRIVEIDGQNASGLSVDDAIKLMKGPIGSKVKLTVVHAGNPEKQTLDVERQVIRIPTVLGYQRLADDRWDYLCDAERRLGYVRLTGFSRHTLEELKTALATLQTQDMQGLVIDMRFNPGGLLSTAVEICDLFIKEGKIVGTAGRNIPESWVEAQVEGTLPDFPLVVLVNRYSASASEVVSACLQDHQRAVVVGERTWGKGSVQNIIELEGGRSALKLTTAGYQRPSGKNIHRFEGAAETDDWGVQPDAGYEVKLSFEEMSELGELRRRLESLQQVKTQAGEEPAAASDRQLEKALEYLRAKLEPSAK